MARPIRVIDDRGMATIEALSVTGLLAVFVAGLLAGAYFLFARTWVRYQSEQALYCLAMGTPRWSCRKNLKDQIREYLPWGTIKNLNLSAGDGVWSVEIKWDDGMTVQVQRELRLRDIVHSRGLY